MNWITAPYFIFSPSTKRIKGPFQLQPNTKETRLNKFIEQTLNEPENDWVGATREKLLERFGIDAYALTREVQ